jgi:hypothetical protein
MSPQNIRIMKETRALFWPWLAVMLLAVSRPLAATLRIGILSGDSGIVGFYLGPPLLAALSFGNEFQYRTVSLLFSQPLDRLQIWREKLAVMLVAVSSASLAYFLTWQPNFERDIIQWVFSAAFVVAAIASSTFWTLIARSTIGGAILNIAVQATLAGMWTLFAQAAQARSHAVTDAFSFLVPGFVGTLCYSGAMLWIGRRKTARFQVTGEIAGQDLFLAHRLMPESVTRWFRWRSAGPTLNLIMKELHLLRPVWLLTSLAIAFLICLTPLRFFSPGSGTFIADSSVAVVGMYLLLTSILAGSLSMGEERQLGTHSWHLTLPISVREQWLIKLISTTLAPAACGFLVLRSADFFLGSVFQNRFYQLLNNNQSSVLLFCILALAFPAFWCACAVNGTVRATVWTVPVLCIFGLAVQFGLLFVRSALGPSVIHQIVLKLHAFPGFVYLNKPLHDVVRPVFLLGLVLAFAMLQSYRLFRREQPGGIRAIVRHLIPVCLAVIFFMLSVGLLEATDFEINDQQLIVVREISGAVRKLELDPATLDAAHPQSIAPEELNRVYPLSDVTKAWLRNASVSVSPKPTGDSLRFLRNGKWQEPTARITANIQFSNGWECRAYDVFAGCSGPGQRFVWFPILLNK